MFSVHTSDVIMRLTVNRNLDHNVIILLLFSLCVYSVELILYIICIYYNIKNIVVIV